MGYSNYNVQQKLEMNTRINHSIQLISGWNATSNHPPQRKVSAPAAMGGGDVIGGEHSRNGWGSTAAAGPGLTQMQNQPPNILDWLTADPEPKHRSVSRGRPSPRQSSEIFIPSEFDNHQPSYAPVPMPLPLSCGSSPYSPVEERWSSWHRPSQSRLHQILSPEGFDESMGSMLHEGPLPLEVPLKPIPPTIFIPPGASFPPPFQPQVLPPTFQPQVYQPRQAQAPTASQQPQRMARP